MFYYFSLQLLIFIEEEGKEKGKGKGKREARNCNRTKGIIFKLSVSQLKWLIAIKLKWLIVFCHNRYCYNDPCFDIYILLTDRKAKKMCSTVLSV